MRNLYQSAFTLIEIVIVVVIIMSLTGLVTANYVQYTEDRKLNAEVAKIKEVLVLARTKATTGDIGTYPCDDFNGYKVQTSAVTRTYSVSLCCAAGCNTNVYPIASYNLPTNIEFRNNFSFVFRPFAQGTTLSADTAIELQNPFARKCNYVKISTIGILDMGSIYGC